MRLAGYCSHMLIKTMLNKSLMVRHGFVSIFHRDMFVHYEQCYSYFFNAATIEQRKSIYAPFDVPRLLFKWTELSACTSSNKIFFFQTSVRQVIVIIMAPARPATRQSVAQSVVKGTKKSPTYIDRRSRPPRGLQNVSDTCYRNAALQALLHLPKFVNWMQVAMHELLIKQALTSVWQHATQSTPAELAVRTLRSESAARTGNVEE
jgi:hypothetical protein